jgi:hypothetical protein
MKHFYYLTEDEEVVRVSAKRKPGPNTIPSSTTWVMQERIENIDYKPEWHGTWEVTWPRLSKLTYIGSLVITKTKA